MFYQCKAFLRQLPATRCVVQESGQQGLQVVKAAVDGRYDSLDLRSQGQLRDGHIVTHLGERHVRAMLPHPCTSSLLRCCSLAIGVFEDLACSAAA